MQRNWISHTFLFGRQVIQPLWKTVWQGFIKLNVYLLRNPTSRYLCKWNEFISIQNPVHECGLAALFMVAKDGNNPDVL